MKTTRSSSHTCGIDPSIEACGAVGDTATTQQAATGPAVVAYVDNDLPSVVEGNPRVEAARETALIAEQEITKARAENGPTLNAIANIEWEDDGSGGGERGLADNGQSVGMRANLPITEAIFGRPKIRRARASARSAALGFRSTEEEMILNLANIQSQIDRDRTVAEALKSHTERLNALYREARGRKASGDISDTDLNQIRVKVIAAKAELSATQASLAEGRAQLPTVIGDSGDVSLRPVAQLLPASVGTVIEITKAANPELRAAREDLAAAQADAMDARRDNLPDINLTASVAREWNDLERGGNDDLYVGIDVDLPIYDGGRRFADIKQKRAATRERDQRVRALERSLMARVRGEWARRRAADEQIHLASERISVARAALSGVREARRVGARLIEDELNAYSDLLAAVIAKSDARRNLVLAEHGLVSQMGQLSTAYKVN